MNKVLEGGQDSSFVNESKSSCNSKEKKHYNVSNRKTGISFHLKKCLIDIDRDID